MNEYEEVIRNMNEEANNFVSITATITPKLLEALRDGRTTFNEVEWVVIPCDQEGQY